MDRARILVVSDNDERADYLVARLLPGAGFEATLADERTPPPFVEVVLVDVGRVLVSPLAGLRAQRRLGCDAPALLVAPRLSEAMAAQIFELGIRDFLTKPAQEDALLAKLGSLAQSTVLDRGQQEVKEQLRRQDEALQRRLREFDALSLIARVLTTVDDVDTVLARIVDSAVYLTRAEEGALFMADETGRLYVRAEKNLGNREVQLLSALSDDSTATYVFQTGEPILRGEEKDVLKVKTGYLVQALINVPIIIGDHIVGVLAVYNHTNKPFQRSDVTTLTALGDYAALALRKAEAITELEERVRAAAEASSKVFIHTDTMYSPIEAIEAQLETLLSGARGPLTEAQSDALHRIRLSAVRLREIGEFVRQLAEQYRPEQGS